WILATDKGLIHADYKTLPRKHLLIEVELARILGGDEEQKLSEHIYLPGNRNLYLEVKPASLRSSRQLEYSYRWADKKQATISRGNSILIEGLSPGKQILYINAREKGQSWSSKSLKLLI